MTEELQRLEQWLKIFLAIAAVSATLFPLLWAFFPWYRTVVGRLLMLQSVSLAAALDLTAYFQFWPPGLDHILVLFWLEAIVFGLIAFSSAMLTYTMFRMNLSRRKKIHDDREHA